MSKNTLDILDVVRVKPGDSELLLSYAIDKPKKGNKIDGTEIEFLGWVVGKKSPAIAVEVVNNDRVLGRIPVDESHPDVGKLYANVPEPKNSGFVAMMDLLGLSETDELLLQAVLSDQSTILMGRVGYELHLLDRELEENVQIEEHKLPIQLKEIQAELDRMRTFFKKIQEYLEQLDVG
ncbi:MAG: hypothetical protein WBA93_34920 [Microcoleaceae cyanobacterium]